MSVVSTESIISSLQLAYWFFLKHQKKNVNDQRQKHAEITKDIDWIELQNYHVESTENKSEIISNPQNIVLFQFWWACPGDAPPNLICDSNSVNIFLLIKNPNIFQRIFGKFSPSTVEVNRDQATFGKTNRITLRPQRRLSTVISKHSLVRNSSAPG